MLKAHPGHVHGHSHGAQHGAKSVHVVECVAEKTPHFVLYHHPEYVIACGGPVTAVDVLPLSGKPHHGCYVCAGECTGAVESTRKHLLVGCRLYQQPKCEHCI